MPPKQRRKSSLASGEHPSKRQKTSSGSKDSSEDSVQEFFNTTLALLQDLRDGKNPISANFLKLPSKKLYPDYYKAIKKPISIEEISSRVKVNEYSTTDEFLEDFKLMADNANEYNEPESQIAIDSLTILDFVQDQVKQFNETQAVKPESTPKLPKIKFKAPVPSTPSTPSTPSNGHISPKKKYLEILEELMDFEVDGVKIGLPFLEEVSRKEYPDYYALIKQAMSLMSVKRHVNGNKIASLEQFIEEVNLIWHNAQIYNEESSLIYQDSKTLEEHFHKRIEEWKQYMKEHGTPASRKKSTPTIKLKAKPPRSKLKIQLKKEEPAEEEVEDDDEEDDESQDSKKSKDDGEEDDEDDDEEDDEADDETKSGEDADKKEESKPEEKPPQIVKPTRKRSSKQTAADALIQEISISSSRSIYKQQIRNQLTSQLPNLFQHWFEYRFEANDFQVQSYTITLPPQQGAVSVLAALNDSLVDRKHQANLTVNGERVNPVPSIQYADSGRQLTSKYELKLALGLNMVVFDVAVDPVQNEESRLRSQDLAPYVEKLTFWVQVVQ